MGYANKTTPPHPPPRLRSISYYISPRVSSPFHAFEYVSHPSHHSAKLC